MNSEAVAALIAKTPTLKAAKARLEAMEPGAYCIHRSWGFGQIKKYDAGTGKLLIDFAGKKAHPMDPRSASPPSRSCPPSTSSSASRPSPR